MIRKLVLDLLRPIKCFVWTAFGVVRCAHREYFMTDERRFWKCSGAQMSRSKESFRSRIIVAYHVVEKGLTMPHRRLGFGQRVVLNLIEMIEKFEEAYGRHDQQVNHAVGVVKAYWRLHINQAHQLFDADFIARIEQFVSSRPSVCIAEQMHAGFEQFYSSIYSPFPDFARSRHTVRHYSQKSIDMEILQKACELATTAPSACNRQHTHLYCVSNKELIQKVLLLQGGNRGFGQDVDKIIVLAGDLNDSFGAYERNDVFVNGGIVLMNLCYSLHYHKIAHCILTASLIEDKLLKIRKLLKLPDNEVIVAFVSCGIAPDEFDVASSPRKPYSEVIHHRS